LKDLEGIARVFTNEVLLGKSIDWYLIKLSSVVTSIKDIYGIESSYKVFEEFLNMSIVTKALEPLACYVDVVEERVSRDPRFSSLRPYKSILVKTLRSIECRDVGLSTMVRESTFKIEDSVDSRSYEVKVRKARKPLIPLIKINLKTLVSMLIVILTTSIIAYLIYILIHSRQVRPSIT